MAKRPLVGRERERSRFEVSGIKMQLSSIFVWFTRRAETKSVKRRRCRKISVTSRVGQDQVSGEIQIQRRYDKPRVLKTSYKTFLTIIRLQHSGRTLASRAKNSRGHGFDSHGVLGFFQYPYLSIASFVRSLKQVPYYWFPDRNWCIAVQLVANKLNSHRITNKIIRSYFMFLVS